MQGHDLYIFNKIRGSFLEFVGMLGSKDFNRIRNCRGMIFNPTLHRPPLVETLSCAKSNTSASITKIPPTPLHSAAYTGGPKKKPSYMQDMDLLSIT